MSLFKSFVDNYWEPPPKVKVADFNSDDSWEQDGE
jgi:hypothetical protein